MKTSMQEKESRQAGAAITRPGLCRARCAEHTRLSGIKAGLRMRHRRLCCLVLFGAEAGVLQNRCVALPPSLRLALQGRRLAPSTINLRLAAVRRLAYEAADTGLLSPELAAGIRRVKGAKRIGVRLGNWLTAEQSRTLLQGPDPQRLKGRRDKAILALLLGCGLRRGEVAALRLADLQQREEHWVIADLIGKAAHMFRNG